MAIDGSYMIHFKTPFGKQEATFTFVTEGDVLTGTANLGDASSPLSEGKVNGNELAFLMDAKTPMGKMKTTVNAIIDGDKITGTLKMTLGTTPFEGNRVE